MSVGMGYSMYPHPSFKQRGNHHEKAPCLHTGWYTEYTGSWNRLGEPRATAATTVEVKKTMYEKTRVQNYLNVGLCIVYT